MLVRGGVVQGIRGKMGLGTSTPLAPVCCAGDSISWIFFSNAFYNRTLK